MNPRLFALAALASLAAGVALAADPAPAGPAAAPFPLVSQEALLAREQQHDPTLLLIDARTPEEYARGHVPGAVNIPYDQVATRLAEIPKDKDIVLYCGSGRRATLAASTLAANGYTRLAHLEGDMAGWEANRRPIEHPAAEAPKTP